MLPSLPEESITAPHGQALAFGMCFLRRCLGRALENLHDMTPNRLVERMVSMWKVWSFLIGLLLAAFLWFTGNWSSGLFALAALLIIIPVFWVTVQFFVLILIWMKLF